MRLYVSGICAALVAFAAVEGRGQDIKPTTNPSTQPSQTTMAAGQGPKKFKKMTLDELMNVEVTSVSKRESTVGQSAAAITVISQDDIHRSGATNIPEALRTVPGLEVAQVNNNSWNISARGFEGDPNKLLVLMDGRSLYSPLYSGVFWDVQDTMMEDIDRIEVIRGPAGALWGANAVNGVINIITKDAQDTQGLLVSGGGGTDERNFESVREGWKLDDNTYARVYAKHFEVNDTTFANGSSADDGYFMTQAGFRIDSRPSPDDHFTLQGDIYGGDENNLDSSDTDLAGGNVLAAWAHKFDNGSDMKLQTYYDRTDRNVPQEFKDDRDTVDFDFQHHIPLGNQDFTWGLGYRVSADEIHNSPLLSFIPDYRAQQLFSGFLQDEIQVVPDKMRLTLGSKFEHNDFTGFEIEPNARLLYMIDKQQAAWAAVSRAVRTPTQLEDDVRIVEGSISLTGNRDFASEELVAYELGYRAQVTDSVGVDIASYYNNYDKLRSLELHDSEFVEGNMLSGQSYGVETSVTWKATDWWTIHAGDTYLRIQLQADPGSTDTTSASAAGDDPQDQAFLRSSMDLTSRVQLDVTARYVSDLVSQKIPSYIAVDVRLAWKPTDQLELAVVGQNLFDNDHPEFGTPGDQDQIPRSVYGEFTFKW